MGDAEKDRMNRDFNVTLVYHLSVEESYVVGKPVIINFTLKNQTDIDLLLLNWYTPFEGLKGRIFLIMCDGKEIPYKGRMVKRGNPAKSDYVRICAGGSLSVKVDLSFAYNLPVSDECQIEFKGKIHDFASDESCIPRRLNDHQGVNVSGNIVLCSIYAG